MMKTNMEKKESSRKGQAAMEYLMTYGWAILVLVIVIAALYYFLPKTQDTCLFQQNFECVGLSQIYVDGNNDLLVSAKLSNRLPQTVQNVKLVCTDAGTGDVTSALFAGEVFTLSDPISAGTSFDAIDVPCVDKDGNRISSTEGAGFKGILAIQYSLSTDVAPVPRITTGTISGTVLKSS